MISVRHLHIISQIRSEFKAEVKEQNCIDALENFLASNWGITIKDIMGSERNSREPSDGTTTTVFTS